MRLKAVHWLAMLVVGYYSALSSASDTADIDYPDSMIFRNIVADLDIGIGEVESIAQDRDGFMWFGARNGLVRYDAYSFKKITIEPSETDEKSPTEVSQTTDLFVDSQGVLWVATRWGLYTYDPDRELLDRWYATSESDINFNQGTYNRVIEIKPGDMLIGTFTGLVRLNTQEKTAYRIQESGDEAGPLSDRINDMFLAADGTVWMGGDGGISRYYPEEDRFDHIALYKQDPNATKENSIQTIEMDAQGNIWAGASKGLYRYSPETGDIKRYLAEPSNPNGLSDDILEDLYLDKQGILWVGTDRGGLNYYNYASDSFRRFTHDESQKGTLSSNITRRIFEDANGDLWIGTYPSGVNFHDRSTSAISVYQHQKGNEQSLATNLVTDIKEDAKGNLWVATDGGGPNYFDRKTRTFKNYLVGGDGKEIGSVKMLCGLVDRAGGVWFGTWDAGVFYYNPATESFEQLPLDTSQAGGNPVKKVLSDTSIWDIYEDSQGELWIASHNAGLIRYDRKEKTFHYFQQDLSRTDQVASNLLWTIFEDSKGRLWVGTVEGLSVMDKARKSFVTYRADATKEGSLANDFVNVIFEDDQNILWIGTNNGLHRFNEAEGSFTVYNDESHGFSDNGIRSIEQDDQQNLWLSTNNGIVVFNPQSEEVTNYRRFNGQKIGGISTGGSLKTSSGEMVFGGVNGLRIYNTARLKKNERIPPVVLTDFKLFTQSVPINGPNNLLSKVINQTQKITLTHKHSMIAFDFAALNFRDSQKNEYAYKLEGFDDDWRDVGTHRQALYTNLAAGEYQFRVKASNNDGLWNEQGSSLTIKQLPPPWLTWWAKLLYVLAVIALLARFVQQQRRKRKAVEEQNRILEMRVAERTSQLQAKNEDIKCMLANMRQGLFTIEPDGSIHPEYSAHLEEIFERSDIAGANACALLFENAHAGSNALNQAREGVNAIIGEDALNFDFNRHVLLEEFDLEVNGQSKSLSLDWNPIVDSEEVVTKLMVSVRDVTLLKQMESEAAAKKRELDMISQLLNLPADKYRRFVTSSYEFLTCNEALINDNADKKPEVVAALFRNMHTIKGNCRTFGFNYLSDQVHDAETFYAMLDKVDDTPWDAPKMLDDIQQVRTILGEYEHIFNDVLGRGNDQEKRDATGFWLTEEKSLLILENIEAALKASSEPVATPHLQVIKGVVNEGLSLSLAEALEDIVLSLPDIAKQLGKELPNVKIDDANIRLRKHSQELINNVFAHLLRNCVDHGIEAKAEREASGKPPMGTITVSWQSTGNDSTIEVFDDGRGLNVQRLYAVGVKRGLWQHGEAVDAMQVCQLIYESGVSTKDEVTDISGRGVGMEAVRDFLRTAGGDIEIVPRIDIQTCDGSEGFVPVSFNIKLPASTFVATSA